MEGEEVELHPLTSALDDDQWPKSCHGRFNPGKELRYYRTGG